MDEKTNKYIADHYAYTAPYERTYDKRKSEGTWEPDVNIYYKSCDGLEDKIDIEKVLDESPTLTYFKKEIEEKLTDILNDDHELQEKALNARCTWDNYKNEIDDKKYQLETPIDFIDDEEKMRDFFVLDKYEFMQSYSYLNENEYDATVKAIDNMSTEEYRERFLKNTKLLPVFDKSDREELIGQMIDIFEDFLTDKKINIPNEERDFNEDLEAENSTNIYGSDYDKLAEQIEATLVTWKMLPKKE